MPISMATSLVDPTDARCVTEVARQPRRGRMRSSASAKSASDRFDFKADVDGGRRMRQRADRHEVGAGARELTDALERDAARDLDLRPPARARDGGANLGERHVV